MLKISNLQVSVENKDILKGVDLCIQPGEVHVVMGLNGSGKSTLSYALAGHPKYEIKNGKIELDKGEITTDSPDERANKGLFLAMQYPVSIPGLSTQSFLWQVYKNRQKVESGKSKKIVDDRSLIVDESGKSKVESRKSKEEQKKLNIVEFRKWIENQAEALGLNPEHLKRGLNDGFSGGEKKKLEVLQMLVFNPKYIILDEIDSGLDVDALKKIALTVAKIAKDNKIGVLLITHYSRVLDFLKPDKVHVMNDGTIIKSGGMEIVSEIEKTGYSVSEA